MTDRFHQMGLNFLRYQLRSLSDIERAVLYLIVAGVPAEDIANKLEISSRRVSGSIAQSMSTLGAADVDDLLKKLALLCPNGDRRPVANELEKIFCETSAHGR
jgi:FixJ family two-component response regulator